MRDEFVEIQKKKLTLGQISRRQFMTSTIAAGITASTAMGLASQALAATPKKAVHSATALDMVQPLTH